MTKAGFVNIVGLPNSGKSTLVNALSLEKLVITSPKPQTTRHRIFSIVNYDNCQIVYSDTPGWILNASYPMHKLMNEHVLDSLKDADLLIVLLDPITESHEHLKLLELVQSLNKAKVYYCINKIDRIDPVRVTALQESLQNSGILHHVYPISALKNTGIAELAKNLVNEMPEHPFYFDDNVKSDKPIRFFISELIREQIFHLYHEEIPFSCYVEILSCKGVDDLLPLAKIEANIIVSKESQVPIILGKAGSKIKELGIKSRMEIEKFLEQKVYLGLSVKFRKDWRNNEKLLEKTLHLK